MSLFAQAAAVFRAPRAAAPCAPVLLVSDAPDEGDEALPGPGWYESSWDLRRGLEVREASWSEAMAAWAAA